MKLEVLHTQWAAEDEVFAGGVHEIEKPTADFLRLVAGAEAAGSVVVLDASDAHRAKLDRHVQSQEDGEAAYAAAQGDWVPPVNDENGVMVEAGYWTGPWHEANVAQYDLDVMSGARAAA